MYDLNTCPIATVSGYCGRKTIAWFTFNFAFGQGQSVIGYCKIHAEARKGQKDYTEISREEAEVLQVHLL